MQIDLVKTIQKLKLGKPVKNGNMVKNILFRLRTPNQKILKLLRESQKANDFA